MNQNYDKIWEETKYRLYVFVKKKTNELARRNKRQQRAYMTRSVHLHGNGVLTVPFNCPITLSNYKHDAYTVLLV